LDGTWSMLAELDARFARSSARSRQRRDAVRRPSPRRHVRSVAAVLGLAASAVAVAVAAGRTDAEPTPLQSRTKGVGVAAGRIDAEQTPLQSRTQAVAGAAGWTAGEPAPQRGGAKAARQRAVYSLPARCRVPQRFQRAFLAASRDTGIPLSLLVSVAYEESRMNPHALSHAGALGLLQLLPSTAEELRLDAARPETNILAGARYLRRMLTRFGDTTLALSAYNAGPAAVVRAGGAPSGAVLTYAANIELRAGSLAACDTG